MSEKSSPHRDEVQIERAQKPAETPNSCGSLGKELVNIYGALGGIRDDFKDVVTRFRAVQQVNKNLIEVIKFSLPKELNKVDMESGVLNWETTDDGYAEALNNMVKQKTNVGRLGILLQIVLAMKDGLADMERKEAKLSERIKLQSHGSAEWKVAVDKRSKIRDGMDVIKNRMADCAERFYKTRKGIMDDVLRASGAFAESFKDTEKNTFDCKMVTAMLKHDSGPDVDALAMLEDGILKANKVKI